MAFGRLGAMGAGFGRMGRATPDPWWLAGASLDLDFARGRAMQSGLRKPLADLLTTTRASDAYAPNAAGVYSLFSSNQPRITDLGLLVEESRTNSIRNNSMQGAVAGTPGTAPTNWAVAATGLTIELVGTGTQNGVDYVDYRLSGTTGATSGTISFETSTGVTAATAQVWTESAFLSFVGGSKTNISQMFFTITENTAAGAFVANNDGSDFLASLTSTLTRFSTVRTLAGGGTVGCAQPRLRFAWSNGVAIDITLRIGWPQLELGAFATSPIRTTSAAATRAADAVTVNNFSSWFNQSAGTIYVEGVLDRVNSVANAFMADFSDGTASEEIFSYISTTPFLVATINDGGGAQASVFGGSQSANSVFKYAAAYASNDARAVLNGSSIGTPDTSMTLPAVDRLYLGSRHNTTFFLNGRIRRFGYKPVADTTAQMQALTT